MVRFVYTAYGVSPTAMCLGSAGSIGVRDARIDSTIRAIADRPLVIAEQEWMRTTAWPRVERSSAPAHGPMRAGNRLFHLATRPRWDHMAPQLRTVFLPALDRMPALPRPGTVLGDLRLLASALNHDSGVLVALDRVVDRIRWFPRNPEVRRALRTRAASEGRTVEQVKRQELRAAIYLALGERGNPQIHRFGSRWLTDKHGHQLPFVPERLPVSLFWRWFQDEVRKIAESSLDDDSYAGSNPTPSVHLPNPKLPLGAVVASGDRITESATIDAILDGRLPTELPLADRDPVEVLIVDEERREVARRWSAVLARATPRQREILRCLVDGDGGNQPGMLADVARTLGVAPSTVRVQWKRLVDRMRSVPT